MRARRARKQEEEAAVGDMARALQGGPEPREAWAGASAGAVEGGGGERVARGFSWGDENVLE